MTAAECVRRTLRARQGRIAAGNRGGQVGTTFSDCGQLSDTGEGEYGRVGQLGKSVSGLWASVGRGGDWLLNAA